MKQEQTAPIHEHALENLRFIRSAMEGAGTFTAVPGWGTIAVGVTAVIASMIAGTIVTSPRWLLVWLVEGVVAGSIGIASIIIKARSSGMSLSSAPARRFALAFLPAMFAGGVMTFVLWTHGLREEVGPMWLLLYGTAVTAGGALSVRIVWIMGLSFALLGGVAFFLPASLYAAVLTVGFGLLHVVFGALIARYHGG